MRLNVMLLKNIFAKIISRFSTESVLMNLVVTSTNLAGVCAFDFEKIGKRMIIRKMTLIFMNRGLG
jgi:hypothetical protein